MSLVCHNLKLSKDTNVALTDESADVLQIVSLHILYH